jgi:maleate cis-trans isomerase
MKRKDIALIAIIVIVSAGVSLLLSNMLFASPQNRQQQVEVVEPITSEFPQPDSKYFNKDSINITKLISIGQSTNTDPFSGASQ